MPPIRNRSRGWWTQIQSLFGLIFSCLGNIFLPYIWCFLYTFAVAVVGTFMKIIGSIFDFIAGQITGTSIVNAFGSGPAFNYSITRLTNVFNRPDPANIQLITPKDLACAVFCKLAFEGDSTRRKVVQKWGYCANKIKSFTYKSKHENFRSFISNGVYNTSAFVFRVTDSAVVVCFRGTQPFQLLQWLTDASVEQHVYPRRYCPHVKNAVATASRAAGSTPDSISAAAKAADGTAAHTENGCRCAWSDNAIQVHRGFLSALGVDVDCFPPKYPGTMFRQLVEYVDSLGVQEVYITGHSLGAALAQQFAFALRNVPQGFLEPQTFEDAVLRVGDKVKGIYTYGTPRSGNTGFANTFDSSYIKNVLVHRIVNNDDIVGRVPFDGIRVYLSSNFRLQFNYKATQGLLYLQPPTPPATVPSITVAPPTVVDAPLGITIGSTALTDHFMNVYHDRLTAISKGSAVSPTWWSRWYSRFQPY